VLGCLPADTGSCFVLARRVGCDVIACFATPQPGW